MGAVDVERRVVGEENPDVVGGGHAVGGGGGERVAGDREGIHRCPIFCVFSLLNLGKLVVENEIKYYRLY